MLFLFFLVLPLGQALNAYTQLQTGLGALQRIEEVLAVPLEGDGRPAGAGRRRRRRAGGPRRSSSTGSASATPAGQPVLREVSFTVPAGTRTALVGPSGAGKSTLLALVERFYEVTAGACGSTASTCGTCPATRCARRLGYVEQEAPVLAGTLRENLLLAAPGRRPTTQLRAVLDEVNLRRPGRRAPRRAWTCRWARAGCCCPAASGSAWRSPGRCWPAPPMLLLDEPTSNLDARNEAALRAAIDAVAAGAPC